MMFIKKVCTLLICSYLWSNCALAQADIVAAGLADHKPFTFLNEEGKMVGFDVDLLSAFADKFHLSVQFVPHSNETSFVALADKKVNVVISGVIINDRRKLHYLLTRPNYEGRQSVAVLATSRVQTYSDLKDKKIAVIIGSPAYDFISRVFFRTKTEVRRATESRAMVDELLAERVDAIVSGDQEVAEIIKMHPQIRALPNANFPKEYRGFLLRTEDESLKNKFDAAFEIFKKDGTYERIYRTWFKSAPPKLPLEAPSDGLPKQDV